VSDTLKIDMAAYKIGAAAARWKNGAITAIAFADALDRFADTVAELERENAALRSAAVEVCALARVWVTVWGDKLSAESIKRLEELEKKILKEAQP
jgi:hypothetical protein